jgi:uncharacterized protein
MTMASTAPKSAPDDLRDRLLADPGLILDDPQVMRALVLASERAMGGNVVDLRGVAMDRLEARIARLEETHRAVIAAAYENLASTNQLHRAILKMLDANTFEEFVLSLGGEVAHVLRVEGVALVLESAETAALGRLEPVLKVRPPGFVGHYMAMGRNVPPRHIVLRQTVPEGAEGIYGHHGADLRSEVLMRLDLGTGRLPGMLAMASEDPHRFRPGQGTDLLHFFAGMFERVLRRWLG